MSMSQELQESPPWTVKLTSRVKKQKERLSADMVVMFTALVTALEWQGPVQTDWHHYGKLRGKKKETHHCHLNKGKPRYVVVWEVVDSQIKLIEVKYAGTHENAPY